jgi:hypothetical protein
MARDMPPPMQAEDHALVAPSEVSATIQPETGFFRPKEQCCVCESPHDGCVDDVKRIKVVSAVKRCISKKETNN